MSRVCGLNFLHLLGTGDGVPNADRNHSAYLYQFENGAFQIDCGEPASRAFKGSGLSYDAVDALVLSHLHSDHIGGLLMLMQGYWLERRDKELVIYLPAEGIEPLRQMFRAAYLFDEALSFELRFEALRPEKPIRLPDVTITPYYTTHLLSTRERHGSKYPVAYEAFCFLIEGLGLRIGHSADLGAPEDLRPLLGQPLDLLVCELAHFEPAELFEVLQEAKIKSLVLTHLSRRWIADREEIAKMARAFLPGTSVQFGNDGDKVGLVPN